MLTIIKETNDDYCSVYTFAITMEILMQIILSLVGGCSEQDGQEVGIVRKHVQHTWIKFSCLYM